MNFVTVLFYILATVLVVSAVRVVTAKSPITAVLFLILAFANAAMIWMLLGAEFLALLLVLVYVGAVMVLFLFVVMMLDVKMEVLREGMRKYLPIGIGVGIILVVQMYLVLKHSWGDAGPAIQMAADYNNTLALGELMYTEYVYAVEVGAVILLVGMIAAISLTLRHRKDTRHNNPGQAVRVKAKDRVRIVEMKSQEPVNAQKEEKS
jgi:NADH-quinone oxidoreductase subunit J